ncbi:unnamed protein product [Symbiodinium natans]|uniref:Uncharacterized protein n=1 Tax=Symbiodinium natans TaxID=878477 RepID=A0A812LU55_9DINO|nr:unnamed protein product [Symbiodinium natans]
MVDARRELQSCDSSTVPPLLTDGGTAAGCIERGFENGFMNVLEDPAALNALKDEKAEPAGALAALAAMNMKHRSANMSTAESGRIRADRSGSHLQSCWSDLKIENCWLKEDIKDVNKENKGQQST